MRVQFEWFNGQWHEVKEDVPFVAIPEHDLAPWHLEVGRVVQLTLPSGKQNGFVIAGLYWCHESVASPLVLLSRVRSPSMYSFSIVVPGLECRGAGCLKRFYHQVNDRSGCMVADREKDKWFRGIRRFTQDTQTDFDFPAPIQPPAQSAAASSSMSAAVLTPQQQAAAVVQPSPEEAIAIAIEEGSDALEAANYAVVLAATTAEAEAAEPLDDGVIHLASALGHWQ